MAQKSPTWSQTAGYLLSPPGTKEEVLIPVAVLGLSLVISLIVFKVLDTQLNKVSKLKVKK